MFKFKKTKAGVRVWKRYEGKKGLVLTGEWGSILSWGEGTFYFSKRELNSGESEVIEAPPPTFDVLVNEVFPNS